MENVERKSWNNQPAGDGGADANVGTQERAASVVTGALVTIFGMRRGGFTGALLALAGGGLILRGMTGHCPAYSALGINTAESLGAYDADSYAYGERESSRPEGDSAADPGRGPGTEEMRYESRRDDDEI
ncbi:MAG TPA: DUF2892 domain-containing protein [Gemmatimonadota bacterium]|jgi:hypothetical protein